jgi:hypothetical protein
MSTLNQKGASYSNRAYILGKDRLLVEALDDIASPVQAILIQGNFGRDGTPDPPSAPTALQASALNGLFTVTIVHPNAPAGTQWRLQYSSSPNFTNPIDVGLLHPNWQASLPQQVLYFRAAAKFSASAQSAWTYLGSSAKPIAVS